MFASASLKDSKRDAWIEHLRSFKAAGGYRGAKEVARAYAASPATWRAMMREGGEFTESQIQAAEVELLEECVRFDVALPNEIRGKGNRWPNC